MTTVVRAAGGVVLRDGSHGPEVLVVHRLRYADWTFPKGKCHLGESDEACAAREVEEETGLRCTLADELPSTAYHDSAGRLKRVRWWRMAVTSGEARPAPPEVDEVRWVPLADALALLTYRRDADLLAGEPSSRGLSP